MKKSILLEALAITKPGLATRELIPQTTAFAFMENRIVTYNDEISISHPIHGINFEGVIQADELYSLLAKVKRKEIEITKEDNNIVLTSGKMIVGMKVQTEIELPLEEITEAKSWHSIPENFCDVLSFVIPASSKDMSRPILTCVHVNKNIVEASDGYRVLQYTLNDKIKTPEFLLPVSAASEVIKMEPTKISKSKGWIHFKTEEETIISCRTYDGKFPNVDHLLQVDGVELTFPKTLQQVLERAMVFAKRDHLLDEAITVYIADKEIRLESDSDTGWFKETAHIRYSGEAFNFRILPYLLHDILEKTNICIVGKQRLKFSQAHWQYVMTLRIEAK